MAFLGRMLQVDDNEYYYKVAIGVETGYNTDVYSMSIPHTMLKVKPVAGDKVAFTGRRAMGDGRTKFLLDSIKYQEFTSCITCGFPLNSLTCVIRHDKEAQKFDGEWEIVHKMERSGNIKMFFLKKTLYFCSSSST